MKIILHHCNTIEKLKSTPKQYGVEVDIRSQSKDLIIHHDPFMSGVLFQDWISNYQHGTLILNVKEEGLEATLIKIMKSKGIKDYFFLDQSFPFLVKWASAGEMRCAVRVSEFEAIESVLSLAGKIIWVWVDCFTHFPLTKDHADKLKKANFKLCLASPELHNRNHESEIMNLVNLLNDRNIKFNAVCTKRPDLWERFCS